MTDTSPATRMIEFPAGDVIFYESKVDCPLLPLMLLLLILQVLWDIPILKHYLEYHLHENPQTL